MTWMSPPGENLRRALGWIADERAARGDAALPRIIEEASVQFNLSPAEEEWLYFTIHREGADPRR